MTVPMIHEVTSLYIYCNNPQRMWNALHWTNANSRKISLFQPMQGDATIGVYLKVAITGPDPEGAWGRTPLFFAKKCIF